MPQSHGFDPELIAALRNAGPEADEQRRALLRGRHVLFVLGSYEGKRMMYQRARELGVRMTILDGPGHWSASATDLFDHTITLDLTERETLPERAVAAIRERGLEFDAVAPSRRRPARCSQPLPAAWGCVATRSRHRLIRCNATASVAETCG